MLISYMAASRLGAVQPEEIFLLRHEDRIWWVQVSIVAQHTKQ